MPSHRELLRATKSDAVDYDHRQRDRAAGFEGTPEVWKPDPYMVEGVSWLVRHGAGGLFLDPGLGKTSITYAAAASLRKHVRAARRLPFLVIAPLRPCYLVWPREARKWKQFRDLRVEVLHGPKKREALNRSADVYVMNPEGLEWLIDEINARGDFPFYGLVVDESTAFKYTNTKRFKLLKALLHHFSLRWILTGTPAPKGLLDLFGQIYIVDQGQALGAYITHYRRKYFAPTGYGGYTWVPQTGAEEKIYERIAPLVLRIPDSVLKLPPIIGNFNNPKKPPSIIRVELPPKARAAYDQLEELFFTELRDGSVTAVNAGVRSMKLAQMANGGLYLDKGGDEDADDVRPNRKRRWSLIHEAKSDAVAELLDELSKQPTLITFDFHHDLERLRKHRDLRNVPHMGSGNTPKEDAALEAAWNRGELDALFVNAQSVAHGLNLQQAGRAVIWHSLTWNWEHYWQLIKRLWRKGQRRKVFVHHVVATDTVDEAKVLALSAKGATERALLDALRRYAATRGRAVRKR